MNNIEIILLVYGLSAILILILIVGFKWLGIRYLIFCKDKNYKEQEETASNNLSNPSPNVNLIEAMEFSKIPSDEIENKCSNYQFKFATRCETDEDDNEQAAGVHLRNYESWNIKIQMELNFDQLENKICIKVLKASNLYQNFYNFLQNKNQLDQENVLQNLSVEFYKIYFLISLNCGTKLKSKVRVFENELIFDQDFHFQIRQNFKISEINIIFYLINSLNGIESIYLKSTIPILDFTKLHMRNFPLYNFDYITKLRGELLISLCFLPTAERLRVVIAEARDLQFENNQTFGNSFVKITLFKNDRRISESFKTDTKVSNSNPVFNETSVFNLSTREFAQSGLRFMVYETISGRNVLIGSFYIGPVFCNSINSHWNQMLKKISRNVILWHPIIEN
ncbi:synaptotagmin-12 [Brachionus plicatilis]|uniref:Synaptotagmin-12 n=1 Tax=Brachionus plicatilis TaxID=10195 RepID=A0A3M7R3X9_BRAPC|nr:synaptotagmin-12 [Brachionus plicatilis]